MNKLGGFRAMAFRCGWNMAGLRGIPQCLRRRSDSRYVPLIAVRNAPNAALVAACRAIAAGPGARVAISAMPRVLRARYLGH